MDALLPDLFGKVIPRLLRPLESEGRTLTPALAHGDLWCGNTGVVDEVTGDAMVFDPACFWAHNECIPPRSLVVLLIVGRGLTVVADELGNWRPERNNLRHCITVYRSLVPPSPPEANFDDRNALYSKYSPPFSILNPDGGGRAHG